MGESYGRWDGWRKIICAIYHVQFLRSWITLSLYNIITSRVFSILILLIHIYEKIFMRFVVIEYFSEARVIYKRYQGILHRIRAASLLLFFTTHYTERCRNAKQRSPFRAGQIDRLKWTDWKIRIRVSIQRFDRIAILSRPAAIKGKNTMKLVACAHSDRQSDARSSQRFRSEREMVFNIPQRHVNV